MSSVGKRRGLEEAVDCVKAGMALSKVAEEFSLACSPWPRPDVPAPAAEARRGSPPFGPEGRRYGCYGGLPGREEPFRSSLLARRLLEGAGEQVVGTATRGRRPWSLTTSRTTRCW